MLAALLLLPFISFAHIIQDDVTVTDKASFSLTSVCQKMVTHESPLIDVISSNAIDCMGKKIEVADFCDKELAQDPYFIRGYVDKEKRQVICQSGKKVIFKYLCVKLIDKQYCTGNHKASCMNLRPKLARRLELVHSSQIKNEKGIPQLSCFFESL